MPRTEAMQERKKACAGQVVAGFILGVTGTMFGVLSSCQSNIGQAGLIARVEQCFLARVGSPLMSSGTGFMPTRRKSNPTISAFQSPARCSGFYPVTGDWNYLEQVMPRYGS
jgi:hypothetical protein